MCSSSDGGEYSHLVLADSTGTSTDALSRDDSTSNATADVGGYQRTSRHCGPTVTDYGLRVSARQDGPLLARVARTEPHRAHHRHCRDRVDARLQRPLRSAGFGLSNLQPAAPEWVGYAFNRPPLRIYEYRMRGVLPQRNPRD